MQIGDCTKWFADDGDNTHRVNYDLNYKSFVLDIGAYKGDWAANINKRFHPFIHCFEPVEEYYNLIQDRFAGFMNILCHKVAVTGDSKQNFIKLNGDQSGFYSDGGFEPVTSVNITTFLKDIGEVDLMKINVEGAEYEIIQAIIIGNLQKKIKNFQVQFHLIEGYQEFYNHIYSILSQTHRLTYRYPFVWENWERI